MRALYRFSSLPLGVYASELYELALGSTTVGADHTVGALAPQLDCTVRFCRLDDHGVLTKKQLRTWMLAEIIDPSQSGAVSPKPRRVAAYHVSPP